MREFFKKGTHINMFGSGNTIFVDSPTTINIDIDTELLANYSVYAQIPVSRNPASPVKKDVHKGVFVKIDCATNPGSVNGPWCLGLPDVYKVTNVYFGSTYSQSNPDKSEWFELAPGQTDTHYGLSYLVLNPKYKGNLTVSSKLLVELCHFSPNITSSQAGFMSIDSYPIDDANTANTMAIQTAEIPVYVDQSQNRYDLRNMIDFRYYIAPTAVSTNNPASATINPATNINTFYTPTGTLGVAPDTEFTYDVEFYMPRRDALLISKDGTLNVKMGEPSLAPKRPAINKAGTVIL